eukprot:COSAG01_NODE_3321_length_6258_cov_1.547167_5_plen_142_part_00
MIPHGSRAEVQIVASPVRLTGSCPYFGCGGGDGLQNIDSLTRGFGCGHLTVVKGFGSLHLVLKNYRARWLHSEACLYRALLHCTTIMQWGQRKSCPPHDRHTAYQDTSIISPHVQFTLAASTAFHCWAMLGGSSQRRGNVL